MDEPRDPTSQAPTPAQRDTSSASQPPAGVEGARPTEIKRTWWQHINVRKIALFLVSLYLFILAITLMKDGARGLAPLVHNLFSVNSPANALGFGWLSAYLIMSGSPIAAASLTLFDAGIINQLESFAMINGSRLGASFIVLFIGFLYVLRGRNRSTSLSMGLLSLTVTAVTHLPAFFLGLWLLQRGILDGVQLPSGALLNSLTDLAVRPVVELVTNLLPSWAVFLVGLGISMVSFNLFDRCLPQATLKESTVGWMSRLVYRPWVMFLLGCLITSISMSVSVSLSILVPLSARGFVRRENVIPYIMGANITTFIDTLLAAVLLKNPEAFTIVLAVMVSVAVVSIVVLTLFYNRFQHRILVFVEWVTTTNRNLAIFMVGIFLVPILLMVL
jgi:solute carrier family 34 (sodium-dependent phosphate cotransporter)